MSLVIRNELPADTDSIRDCTVYAFANSELGHNGEAELIERLRAECPEQVSLVAELNGKIVGHILFTPAVIRGTTELATGMGLAPMSVMPDCQQQGIGSQLVESGLQQLRDSQCAFAMVLGHPDFYARFGFEPAHALGITSEFDGIPDDVFRVAVLQPNFSCSRGVAQYHPEFSRLA